MNDDSKTCGSNLEESMNLSGPQAAAKGKEVFEAVLRARVVREVAKHLETSESKIEQDTSLMSIGLDSLALFSMTGRLAEWMEQDIPVTLLFEIESINDLVIQMANLACPE